MGQRAMYTLYENGENHYYYSHWGANALSPLMKLLQAQAISDEKDLPINHIFEHLDYDAGYQNPRLDDGDMFFSKMDILEANEMMKRFRTNSDIEMLVTLDLDSNECMLDYNPNCPWFNGMGKYTISIEDGLDNVSKLIEYAERKGINSFGEVLQVYNQATGMEQELANARTNEIIENYAQSHQAEEQRNRLYEMASDEHRDFEMEV
ncbi:MAG: hypothetical protein R3Y47_12975 [Lachnospiraceae bacterium]